MPTTTRARCVGDTARDTGNGASLDSGGVGTAIIVLPDVVVVVVGDGGGVRDCNGEVAPVQARVRVRARCRAERSRRPAGHGRDCRRRAREHLGRGRRRATRLPIRSAASTTDARRMSTAVSTARHTATRSSSSSSSSRPLHRSARSPRSTTPLRRYTGCRCSFSDTCDVS